MTDKAWQNARLEEERHPYVESDVAVPNRYLVHLATYVVYTHLTEAGHNVAHTS